MKNNRRDFLKISGLAGLGIAGGSVLSGFASETKPNLLTNLAGHMSSNST